MEYSQSPQEGLAICGHHPEWLGGSSGGWRSWSNSRSRCVAAPSCVGGRKAYQLKAQHPSDGTTTTTTNRIALATSSWAELLFFMCLARFCLAFKAHFEHFVFLCCLG